MDMDDAPGWRAKATTFEPAVRESGHRQDPHHDRQLSPIEAGSTYAREAHVNPFQLKRLQRQEQATIRCGICACDRDGF